MDTRTKWNLLLLPLFALFLTTAAIESCEQKSGCECEFSDGTSINLGNMFQNDNNDGKKYLYDTKDNTTIYYHGCVDVPFQVEITDINDDHCRLPASICVFDSGERTFETLGKSTSGKFSIDDHNIHTLTYDNTGRITTVRLICTPELDENNIDFHDVSKDGKQYKLLLYSQHACRSLPAHVLSTGTKLLIMFFTFLLVYFIGGALLAFFVRGARGRELIPNVEFWTNLPGLVKDGVIFLMSGCSTRLVTTAETYDQI